MSLWDREREEMWFTAAAKAESTYNEGAMRSHSHDDILPKRRLRGSAPLSRTHVMWASFESDFAYTLSSLYGIVSLATVVFCFKHSALSRA